MKNNEHTKFEDFIREKLESVEFPYDNNNWLRLEKSLPKKSFLNNNWKTIAAISAVAITLGVTSLFVINNKQKVNTNKIIKTQFSLNKVNSNNSNVAVSKKQTHKNTITTNNIIQNKTISNLNDNVSIQNNNTNVQIINITTNNTIDNNNSKTEQIKTKTILPNASFIYNKNEGCGYLNVKFIPIQISDTINYLWNFGDGKTSTNISPNHIYAKQGNYNVSLTITFKNSNQNDTKNINNLIKVYRMPLAKFDYTKTDNNISFKNLSVNYDKCKWLIDSKVMEEENPEYTFNINGNYKIKLIAYSNEGCTDTVNKNINIVNKPTIQIANAFSPDGDGRNDDFGPGETELLDYIYTFVIYSKSGQIVFESNDVQNKWNGTKKNGQPAEKDKYFWKIVGKDKYGNPFEQSGDVTLIK